MRALIRQIYSPEEIKQTDSYYGRKIRAYIAAYGTGYDFCRLYADDNNGAVLVYNSLAVVDADKSDELDEFIEMISPVTVEAPIKTSLAINDNYKRIHRTLFRVMPNEDFIDGINAMPPLDEVYKILAECFDDIDYEMWYTDASHRIRHGISRIYLYGRTTAELAFYDDGFAFLSHIATALDGRGKGAARALVGHIAGTLEKQNTYLFARDFRRSFYESFGSKAVGEDILYQIEN